MQIESVNDHVKWEVLRSCFGQADLHDPKKYDIFCTAINISRHLQCMEVPTLKALPMRGNISPSSVWLGLCATHASKNTFMIFSAIKRQFLGTVRSMIWIKFTEKYQQVRVASRGISNSEGRDGRPRRGMMMVKFNLQISYFFMSV